jgi:hypothetical protein
MFSSFAELPDSDREGILLDSKIPYADVGASATVGLTVNVPPLSPSKIPRKSLSPRKKALGSPSAEFTYMDRKGILLVSDLSGREVYVSATAGLVVGKIPYANVTAFATAALTVDVSSRSPVLSMHRVVSPTDRILSPREKVLGSPSKIPLPSPGCAAYNTCPSLACFAEASTPIIAASHYNASSPDP